MTEVFQSQSQPQSQKTSTEPRVVNPTTRERVLKLRNLMQQHKLDYYLVPSIDQHHNEYLPESWRRRPWISSFTGSAGDALIGLDQAYLWTDPRYYLQASLELDSEYFTLMKMQQGQASGIGAWLQTIKKPIRCGVDPKVLTYQQAQKISQILAEQGGQLVPIENNLIDQLWLDRPALPQDPVRIHSLQFAGVSAREKMLQVRETMKANQADAHIITLLDSIAWLFNIRGNDIAYTPLVISYAVITADKAILFVDQKKISAEAQQYLTAESIEIQPYETFQSFLNQLTGNIWIDSQSVSWWVVLQLKKIKPGQFIKQLSAQKLFPMATIKKYAKDNFENIWPQVLRGGLIEKSSPIVLMKAMKNTAEISGAIAAHQMDGIAVIRFLAWLERSWGGQANQAAASLTEISAAQQLEKFRRANPKLLDLSFNTISSFGPNGAIIHYSPSEKTNLAIRDDNLYLIDSGGQYAEGTTDITRTIHLGTPSKEQIYHYTLVLKGHLALRRLIFPDGTSGEQINMIAHAPLWGAGLDFGHGTGHGVGSYLCVHEGPQRISGASTGVPLKPGMIVSNEPGVYLSGQYGIRIENLCVVRLVIEKSDSLTGDGPFYRLEDLTLVPYCRKLIDKSLLTAEEVAQVDEYHEKVERSFREGVREVGKWGAGGLDSRSREEIDQAAAWVKNETAGL